MSSYAIMRELRTALVGRSIIYHPTLASTMDAARDEARRGVPEGTVIIAGEQTGGRGRLRRAWLSPPGNIALSVILYPPVSILPYLVMIASLAAARSIQDVTGLPVQVKWPNDLLIFQKKVGGILIENEVKADRAASVIGIGINTALDPAAHPEITATAASLPADRDVRLDIILGLLTEIERLYLMLPGAKTSIYETWRISLLTLGREVRATFDDGTFIEGKAEDVAETGALLIRRPDGSLVSVVAGDVTLRHNE
jgi:BirA family biotin operon repressor/biotin-[acetyl-CoA-carboxylase] ligase